VSDQAAFRHPDYFFRIKLALILWYDRSISNKIVDVVSAHGPWIAEIIDLNRGGASCHDIAAVILRKTHQIDGNISFKLANDIRNFLIAFLCSVDEMLECIFYSPPHRRFVVRTERYSNYFKSRSVVLLEQSRG